jgi:hypothetical protein
VNCLVMNESNVIVMWLPLKSYEEITAMTMNNAVVELNTYPTEYYDKFNSEWHIYNSYWTLYLWTSNTMYSDGFYTIVYANWVWSQTRAAAIDF